MFRNHLAALVAPLALLVARYRPSWRAVVITALITVPFQAFQLRPAAHAEGLPRRRRDGRRRAPPAPEGGLGAERRARAGLAGGQGHRSRSSSTLPCCASACRSRRSRSTSTACSKPPQNPRECAVVDLVSGAVRHLHDAPSAPHRPRLRADRGLRARESSVGQATLQHARVRATAHEMPSSSGSARCCCGFPRSSPSSSWASTTASSRNRCSRCRAGGLPFREVFSSQGPLFLPMAWLGDLLTGRTIDSPRTIAVLSGVALAIAVYCTGRELTTARRRAPRRRPRRRERFGAVDHRTADERRPGRGLRHRMRRRRVRRTGASRPSARSSRSVCSPERRSP